jgi:hypothetical protein
MSRAARVWAIAVQDWRVVLGGRRWFGLPSLALLILLPAAALRLPQPPMAPRREPPPVAVSGPIPFALQGVATEDALSETRIVASDPITVDGPMPDDLRRGLDRNLGPPTVQVRITAPDLVSARPVLVLLLAISLLTGPMSESLPAERSERTLEVLLSASITRLELVLGKWLAWTLGAASVALASVAGGLLSHAIEPGGWIVGIPIAIAVIVALALFLVRNASDVVGGATIPMRVLPVVAVALLAAAWWLAGYSPILGAAVPIGGALLLTGEVVAGPACVAVAIVSHVAAVALLLHRTADALREIDPKETPARWRSVMLVAAPVLLWWLVVGGAGVWDMAGHPVPTASSTSSALAGGAILLLLGGVVAGQPQGLAWRFERPPLRRVAIAVLAGALLAAALPVLPVVPGGARRARRAPRAGARVPRRRPVARGRARCRARVDGRGHAVRSARWSPQRRRAHGARGWRRCRCRAPRARHVVGAGDPRALTLPRAPMTPSIAGGRASVAKAREIHSGDRWG